MVRNYRCPRCGYGGTSMKNKFPICECCGYEDVIVDETGRFGAAVDEYCKKFPQKSLEEIKDMVREDEREKYTYNSPVFSKTENAKRIKYEEAQKQQWNAQVKQAREDWQRLQAGENVFNNVKCPTCGSTNTRKISAGAKAVSVGLFGIFSQKVKHQFHCNSCGYEW